MKVLVLSLLRLGDALMHRQAADFFDPSWKLSWLINEQVSQLRSIERVFDPSTHLHLFPRQSLQDQIVLKEGNFFSAFQSLQSLIWEIRAEDYDLVLDLTHTNLSRAIVAALGITEVQKRPFSHLNEFFKEGRESTFHYVESLVHSFGATNLPELPTAKNSFSSKIVVQPLTSDLKKNWSTDNWCKFLKNIAKENPQYKIRIVGAEFEEHALQKFKLQGFDVFICSLKDLANEIADAKFVISGDTATIHLAALLRVKVFGIYLGSADPTKTGPYLQGSWVVQSTESCAPCVHSSPCYQTQHLCSQQLTAQQITDVFTEFLQNKTLEKTSRQPFMTYGVSAGSSNQYVAANIANPTSKVLQEIRQLSFLDEEDVSGIQINDEILFDLMWYLDNSIQNVGTVIELFDELDVVLGHMGAQCIQRKDTREIQLHLKNWVKDFCLLSQDMEWGPRFRELNLLQNEPDLAVLRHWKALASKGRSFFARQLDLTVQLKNRIQGRGEFNVPGTSKAT